MSNSNVVELFDDMGNPVQYRKLSARMPQFLSDYPPKEGYAVIVEMADPISLKPGLLRLYEAAINAGKSFEECGLPNFSGQDSLVYTAKLINTHNGTVICTRSAVLKIAEYKDHESGETAAVQRLLSALGYDGAVLDDDEATDFATQGMRAQAQSVQTATKPAAKTEPVNTDQSDKKQASSVDAEKSPPDDVPDSMLRQMQNLAEIKDIPIPEYTDLKSAKKALKELQVA